MDLPRRKLQRLNDYDYSQNNAYFITVCTQSRLKLFGEIIDNTIMLNEAGKMVDENLKTISKACIILDKYVVMPNHIHAIILYVSIGTTQRSFPTLSELVQRFKTITTKLYIDGVKEGKYPPFDKKIWQKSFYDHVIRDEKGYLKIWKYIDSNPLKWLEDEYYVFNN